MKPYTPIDNVQEALCAHRVAGNTLSDGEIVSESDP
jgi:hypothetical protein